MIPVNYRFHGHNSLRFVYANGKAVRSRFATIKFVPNARRTKPRISVVVSKKVLKSAVGRNRIRRRVYEYMRQQLPHLRGIYDIVVIITSSEVHDLPASELHQQLDQLISQSGISHQHQSDTPHSH